MNIAQNSLQILILVIAGMHREASWAVELFFLRVLWLLRDICIKRYMNIKILLLLLPKQCLLGTHLNLGEEGHIRTLVPTCSWDSNPRPFDRESSEWIPCVWAALRDLINAIAKKESSRSTIIVVKTGRQVDLNVSINNNNSIHVSIHSQSEKYL